MTTPVNQISTLLEEARRGLETACRALEQSVCVRCRYNAVADRSDNPIANRKQMCVRCCNDLKVRTR